MKRNLKMNLLCINELDIVYVYYYYVFFDII